MLHRVAKKKKEKKIPQTAACLLKCGVLCVSYVDRCLVTRLIYRACWDLKFICQLHTFHFLYEEKAVIPTFSLSSQFKCHLSFPTFPDSCVRLGGPAPCLVWVDQKV